ncbi:membrane protein, partial [Staphylococcus epidermidis MC28]
VLVIIFEKIVRSLAGVKGGFILKVFLYFIYFFVAFFVVDSLISLVFPIEFDVYTNLITAFFFAVFMTPLFFVLKQDKNKK